MTATMEAPRTLKVTEAGDRMCFWVSSASNPGTRYKVDLTALGGYGSCQCLDWALRRSSNISRRMPMGSRATLCKHGEAARNYFLNGLLRAMAKSEERR